MIDVEGKGEREGERQRENTPLLDRKGSTDCVFSTLSLFLSHSLTLWFSLKTIHI